MLEAIGAIIAGDVTARGARSALPDAPVLPDDRPRAPSALRRWTAARLAGIAFRLDPANAERRVIQLQQG